MEWGPHGPAPSARGDGDLDHGVKLHQPHPINDGNGAAFMVHMPAGVMSIRGGTGMVEMLFGLLVLISSNMHRGLHMYSSNLEVSRSNLQLIL